MIFDVIRMLMHIAIGWILIDCGMDITTWQYWVIMMLSGVGIPIMCQLYDINKKE